MQPEREQGAYLSGQVVDGDDSEVVAAGEEVPDAKHAIAGRVEEYVGHAVRQHDAARGACGQIDREQPARRIALLRSTQRQGQQQVDLKRTDHAKEVEFTVADGAAVVGDADRIRQRKIGQRAGGPVHSDDVLLRRLPINTSLLNAASNRKRKS